MMHENALEIFEKGVSMAALSRNQEAIELYEKAINDSPEKKFPEAYYNKGVCLLALNRYEEAIEAFEKSIEDSPQQVDPEAFYGKGNGLARLGRYQEAIEAYDKAIEQSPDGKHPDASLNKGASLAELSKHLEAIESYDKAVKDSLEELNPTAYCNKGVSLENLHRYQEAIELYDKAIDDSPESKFAKASFRKGICLENLGRYQEAIEAFDKAILDSPDQKFPSCCNIKGIRLAELGRHQEAVEAYIKAIEDSPGRRFSLASNNKGTSLHKLFRYEEAIESYDKAIEDSPEGKFAETSYHKGITLGDLGRYQEAIEALDKAIEDSPDRKYPDACNLKGSILALHGKYQEAIEAFDKAINDSENGYFPVAWINKAKILYFIGRLTASRQAAFQSIAQSNYIKDSIYFINERFSRQKIYEKRLSLLDIIFVYNNINHLYDSIDAKSLLANVKYEGSTDLYCELLQIKTDILQTGKTYYERLRLSYLGFATNNRYDWVYFIIEYLLDDGSYTLNPFDIYFYLTAASNTGASKEELNAIITSSDLSVDLVQVDEYLYQLRAPLETVELSKFTINDSEKEILNKYYLKSLPYETEFTINELLATFLSVKFKNNASFVNTEDVLFLNLRDSLLKDILNLNQVANNIAAFIDGKTPGKLAQVLYFLSDQNIIQKIDTIPFPNAGVLRSFAILKYELLKLKLTDREVYTIQTLSKGLLTTLIGDMSGGIVSMFFLSSLALTYAMDFVLDFLQSKIKLNADFTWEQYIDVLKNKDKRISL